MAVDMKGLKEFVKLAKDSGASELVYETKAVKLKVNFGGGAPVVMHHAPMAQATAAPAAKAETTKAAPAVDPKLHVVKSPFVGTFYGSPAPGKPMYVKVGDKVKVGQPLCILEAMKIMNEIDSDMAGEVVEVCVETESLVEYGQALFKIRLA